MRPRGVRSSWVRFSQWYWDEVKSSPSRAQELKDALEAESIAETGTDGRARHRVPNRNPHSWQPGKRVRITRS